MYPKSEKCELFIQCCSILQVFGMHREHPYTLNSAWYLLYVYHQWYVFFQYKMAEYEFTLFQHCAKEGCTSELSNHHDQNVVFCQYHKLALGAECHIRDCWQPKVQNTMTCTRHERGWQAFNQKNNRQTQPGLQRALRRSDNDWPWALCSAPHFL